MPYSKKSGGFERSRSIAHVPIVENQMIRDRLQTYRLFQQETEAEFDQSLLIQADDLGTPGEHPRWVMSFDGSQQEVAIREKYPSTRIGYLQIAGVLVNLVEMLGQATQPLVDPAALNRVSKESLYSLVVPGSNVCRADMPTVKDSWRAEVFDVFRNYNIEDTSLLKVFMRLVKLSNKITPSGGVLLARCSADETCLERNIDVPPAGRTCPRCGGQLFPTDTLRFHEEVSEEHANATSLGRLMSCLEQLTMVAYLQFLSTRLPRVLGHIGLILDGPLAVFGPQAWLHEPIASYIRSLGDSLEARNLNAPLLIGVEKTGLFAEHGEAIADRIPLRHLMMLPDDYVYRHVLTFRTTPGAPFGRDTYYGQKFYYKTARGQLLTFTIPCCTKSVSDPYNPVHYPALPNILSLFDIIGTTLYEDALIPIALAHSFASIPLRTGSKVLKLLSQTLLGDC